MSTENPWWRGGVIYQIYPRSYADANRDGVGDLRGITEKLDYVASLNVDAIWLSPFFKSPMKDFGYDVSDYRDVDPTFGTLDDFKALLEKAHRLGIKIIIDQVISHTSNEHAWFQESRQSASNPKADWYIWQDAKPDGTPPNNWMSIFGGTAWEWDSQRKQYFMHNFLREQPDLNLHNPEVQDAVLGEMRFWLELGVDGFRLDTANFYMHDPEFRDNPPRDMSNFDAGVGGTADNPYFFQQHVYDKDHPDNFAFLARIRALLDEFGITTTVGEVGSDDPSMAAQYTQGNDKLHMAYSFDFLNDTVGAAHIRKTIRQMENMIGDGWPCWALSNHDFARVVSRWKGYGGDARQRALLFNLLLMTLRGSVSLYQGEELGLEQPILEFDELVDPYDIMMYPHHVGRDGCRTPMVWESSADNGGFSSVKPWLPVRDHHAELAVDAQIAPDSVLNLTRSMIHWRKHLPALVQGDIQVVERDDEVVEFTRTHNGQTLWVALNMGQSAVSLQPPAGAQIIREAFLSTDTESLAPLTGTVWSL